MNKKHSKKGFTLIELMTVVIIIGILAAIAMPSYFSSLEVSHAKEATDFIKQWQAARAIYMAEHPTFLSATADERILGLDSIRTTDANGIISYRFKYFDSANIHFADVPNSQNPVSASVILPRTNGLYSIYGTDTAIYCCWTQARAQKVCASLSSEPGMSNDNYLPAGMSCYKI